MLRSNFRRPVLVSRKHNLLQYYITSLNHFLLNLQKNVFIASTTYILIHVAAPNILSTIEEIILREIVLTVICSWLTTSNEETSPQDVSSCSEVKASEQLEYHENMFFLDTTCIVIPLACSKHYYTMVWNQSQKA